MDPNQQAVVRACMDARLAEAREQRRAAALAQGVGLTRRAEHRTRRAERQALRARLLRTGGT